MTLYWLSGLVRHRTFRLIGAGAGVALTVALLASLGLFLSGSSASMTKRAAQAVPIDWQVEAVPGADTSLIRAAIAKAAPVKALHEVLYARTEGFSATAGGTDQTTGPGKVIAFDTSYSTDFPSEVRLLSGAATGVLIAQQTAANLHVGPGDTVSIIRVGLGPETVTITGVVDMPDADALFQGVGLPPQAAPQAPPDNVLILPPAAWHRIFDAQSALRPDTTRTQLHVKLDHAALASHPDAAYVQVVGQAHNLEAQVAGQALVANNLGARLDAVRGDALYATVLFLFLGVPGAVLAGVLTLAIAATGAGGRRREQALLRVRGASTLRILHLSAGEAVLAGLGGIAVGLAAALLFSGGHISFAGGAGLTLGLTALAGLGLALAAVVLPAWRLARNETTASARRRVQRFHAPVWQRYWFDLVLLAGAALLFWQSAGTGYQIVLAPEGVAATSVDYKAFLAPALFWAGSALLIIRLAGRGIAADGKPLKLLTAPFAGPLTDVVTGSMALQSRRLTLGVAMTALAVSFAASTAIFNATYNAQARVDAELTNGADVTVFGTTDRPAGPHLADLSNLPGTAAAEPMQHRFAYVGADLQDLYGINPTTLGRATTASDAYFASGSAAQVLALLANTPDGVLVSDETVSDYQLKQGDTINLRLAGPDHQYHPVPFTFIGITREFPTAPKDSFLVANAAYISKVTGNPAQEYVLMRAKGDPATLASAARTTLTGTQGLTVKDISQATHLIGSSLTAVDLSSLTGIELTFALILAAAASGLMLVLGFNDRRRDFAVLTAIGAKPRQLSAFMTAEAAIVVAGGVILGLISGTVTAWMLVKLLTGVFDPAPEALTVPWAYLLLVLVLLVLSVAAALWQSRTKLMQGAVEALREL